MPLATSYVSKQSIKDASLKGRSDKEARKERREERGEGRGERGKGKGERGERRAERGQEKSGGELDTRTSLRNRPEGVDFTISVSVGERVSREGDLKLILSTRGRFDS